MYQSNRIERKPIRTTYFRGNVKRVEKVKTEREKVEEVLYSTILSENTREIKIKGILVYIPTLQKKRKREEQLTITQKEKLARKKAKEISFLLFS